MPQPIPTLVSERSSARPWTRSPSGTASAISALRTVEPPRSQTAAADATSTKAAKESTATKASVARPSSTSSTTSRRRAPRRSARWPNGIPASTPQSPAMVRPTPTWATESPTMRVKKSALVV